MYNTRLINNQESASMFQGCFSGVFRETKRCRTSFVIVFDCYREEMLESAVLCPHLFGISIFTPQTL